MHFFIVITGATNEGGVNRNSMSSGSLFCLHRSTNSAYRVAIGSIVNGVPRSSNLFTYRLPSWQSTGPAAETPGAGFARALAAVRKSALPTGLASATLSNGVAGRASPPYFGIGGNNPFDRGRSIEIAVDNDRFVVAVTLLSSLIEWPFSVFNG